MIRQASLLESHPNTAPESILIPIPRHAKDFDSSGRRLAKTFQNFDRRRLPGTIGPKKPKALAAKDFETQPSNGLDRPLASWKRLYQVFDEDGRTFVRHRSEFPNSGSPGSRLEGTVPGCFDCAIRQSARPIDLLTGQFVDNDSRNGPKSARSDHDHPSLPKTRSSHFSLRL
jgi:hypothetical protein